VINSRFGRDAAGCAVFARDTINFVKISLSLVKNTTAATEFCETIREMASHFTLEELRKNDNLD
jgi:hypothetical protein